MKHRVTNWESYVKLATTTMPKGMSLEDMLVNVGLGVAGEAGEVADLIKKATYQGHELDITKLTLEAGDVLWYLAILCHALKIDMRDMAQMNIDKLKKRYPEGFEVEKSTKREKPVSVKVDSKKQSLQTMIFLNWFGAGALFAGLIRMLFHI